MENLIWWQKLSQSAQKRSEAVLRKERCAFEIKEKSADTGRQHNQNFSMKGRSLQGKSYGHMLEIDPKDPDFECHTWIPTGKLYISSFVCSRWNKIITNLTRSISSTSRVDREDLAHVWENSIKSCSQRRGWWLVERKI